MNNPEKSYIESAAEIGSMISELQTFTNKMHDKAPDTIHWGHVGDLQHIRATLAALLERTRHVA